MKVHFGMSDNVDVEHAKYIKSDGNIDIRIPIHTYDFHEDNVEQIIAEISEDIRRFTNYKAMMDKDKLETLIDNSTNGKYYRRNSNGH